MKANSNLAILNLFARLGSGFDIVSGGELARVIAAGGDPAKVVFSGVGKSEAEMAQALAAGILCFNVESAGELERLNTVAGALGKRAPVSFRVNPDVDPKTHPYIATGLKESKFGVAFDGRAGAVSRTRRACRMSPSTASTATSARRSPNSSTYVEATAKVLDLVDRLGPTASRSRTSTWAAGSAFATATRSRSTSTTTRGWCSALFTGARSGCCSSPAASLVGNAGVLLTRVEYLKPGTTKNFAIVDAAMNDLLRPALYDAWHPVDPVRPRVGR